jgi:O-methyltransferase involved in polyketide biosynthesis
MNDAPVPRGPSRSAALVAACRLLAADQPEAERIVDDPFARLLVDDDAIAAARAEHRRVGGPDQLPLVLRR